MRLVDASDSSHVQDFASLLPYALSMTVLNISSTLLAAFLCQHSQEISLASLSPSARHPSNECIRRASCDADYSSIAVLHA